MHRDGEIIKFNVDEQHDFDVPAVVPVEDAVELADVFCDVAGKITEISIQRITYAAHRPDLVHEVLKNQNRAAKIGNFAAQILDLCPDEHLELIVKRGRSGAI